MDDDFAKQHSLIYPQMVFTGLRVPDDGELLKPIVMTMYALTMDDPDSPPLAQFEPTRVNSNRLQYTLSATIPDNSIVEFRAWNALQTVSPTRVKAVHVQPYFDEALNSTRIRIVVDVLSIMAPLSSTFDTYLRKDRSFLVPTRSKLIAPPAADATSDEAITVATTNNDSLSTHEETVHAIRRTCRDMTRARDAYVFDQNFIIDLDTMTMQWRLPAEQMLDIGSLFLLMAKFSDYIKHLSVGMKVARDGLDGFRPLMQIVVNIGLVSHKHERAVMIDTKTMLFFVDPTPATAANGKNAVEPWYFDASGPMVAASAAATASHGAKNNTNNDVHNIKTQGAAAALATNRRTTRSATTAANRVRDNTTNNNSVTRKMVEIAKRPTNLKRQRPASLTNHNDDDDDVSESSSSCSSSSYSESIDSMHVDNNNIHSSPRNIMTASTPPPPPPRQRIAEPPQKRLRNNDVPVATSSWIPKWVSNFLF
jgi:hypothetical protein